MLIRWLSLIAGATLATLAMLHVVPMLVVPVGLMLLGGGFGCLLDHEQAPRRMGGVSYVGVPKRVPGAVWDAKLKSWLVPEGDPSDPYNAPIAFEKAFPDADPLAPHASTIAEWRRQHAQGLLSTEQLVHRIENVEERTRLRER